MFRKIWQKFLVPFKAVAKSIFDPSPRAKVRWAILGIVLLALFSGAIVYPQGYNSVIDQLNGAFSNVPVLQNYEIQHVPQHDFRLGLDLQGGAHLVYQAELDQAKNDNPQEVLARLRDRIERRVNGLGVSEPLVQVAGNDRLVVELAGVNADQAIDQIGQTPVLEFREPNTDKPRDLTPDEKKQMDDYNAEQLQKAKDALKRVTSGQESFEDVAKEVSEDVDTRDKGGDLGLVSRATNPDLVNGIGSTRIGRVVPSVIETSDAYEVVRVDDRQSNDVEMLISHILICYKGSAQCDSDLSREDALAKIQQIKDEVTTANFSEKATQFSTDPSVTQNKGDLGWIAPATTVPAFEDAAKALNVGQISDPVETDFGWHLIYKRDERPYEQISVHHIQLKKKTAQDILPKPDQWKNTGLTGENVVDAQLVFAPKTNAPEVSIQFDDAGTKLFADLTKKYLNQQIAIFLDGQPRSIPTVQQVISNGQAVISGSFSVQEARDLARGLKDGALPVKIDLVQQQTVGASLGADSLQKSLEAGLIGLIAVALFMIIYYRLLGFLAVVALGLYGLISLMLFKYIGVTLTLSGIAGFVLSIGMAVDANVLVFERFREERERGRDLLEATDLAFTRAWPSIRDGNVSTLITCFILGWFGTSLIQGFAVTLALGILVSMFTAVVITRSLMKFVLGWSFVRKATLLFGSSWRLKG